MSTSAGNDIGRLPIYCSSASRAPLARAPEVVPQEKQTEQSGSPLVRVDLAALHKGKKCVRVIVYTLKNGGASP